MSKGLVFSIIFGLFALFLALGWYNNYSAALQERELIHASKSNVEGVFDNTWKKISQSTQVVKFDRNSLRDIIVQNAQARTGSGNQGSLMKWVQESVPNVSSDTTKQLINIINGARDEYIVQQTGYNDHVRAYNQRLVTPFIGFLLTHVNGLTKEDYLAITSTRSKEAFKTGVDDEVDLGLGK